MHVRITDRSDPARYLRVPRLLLALLVLAPAALEAFTLTNVTPVNVTPHGFSVVFHTSEPTTPGISVYADAAGTTSLAGQVGIELLPLHTGDRAIAEAYARRQNLKSIRVKTLGLGLAQVRVSDCQPGVTYYYRVQATSAGGQQAVWPASGPLPAVTTATENAFVLDARQLVIDLPGADPEGQILILSSTNAAYALAAVAGDGVGTNQVLFNLADLLALSGRTNYLPLGPQKFTARIPGRTGSAATNEYTLAFTTQFVVGTRETQAFVGEGSVAVTLGRTVMRTGETSGVPIGLFATTALTNVTLMLDLPTNRLVNLALQNLAPAIGSASVQTVASNRAQIVLGAASGQAIQSAQPLATLTFTAASNQTSAFIPLLPVQLSATGQDGALVTDLYAGSGRVVVVGAEPLLETEWMAANTPSLILYGKVGTGYQIQYAADLTPPVDWRGGPLVALTNILQTVETGSTTGSLVAFRAYELPGDRPFVSAGPTTNRVGSLIVFGQPGSTYQLQSATNLSGVVVWRPQLDFTLTNSFGTLGGLATTNPLIFYRILKP